MKKVVHIIQSLNKGGAEAMLTQLAELCSPYYEITVICQFNMADDDFSKRLKKAGIELILLNKKKGFDLFAFIELWKVLQKIKPDIVHTHLYSAMYVIPWYVFHKNHRRIHTIHSIPKMEFTKLHMTAQFFAYHFLGVIPVAISETVRKQTSKLYHIKQSKIALIYNGIDISRFNTEPIFDENYFNIIQVASFSPWKNQQMMVHAFHRLYKNNKTFRLTFVGDGILRESIKELCDKLMISNAVNFTGNVDDVALYLKNSHVFVLCSTFEGLPLSILEAYAQGLPVVSTNVGGIPDILEENENGFLVESENVEQLADAIYKLYKDKNLFKSISQNNRRKAVCYDIKKSAEGYRNLYE